MTTLPEEDLQTFPFATNENSKIHSLKCKGTPAHIKRKMTVADFTNTIIRGQEPRKVQIYSMRRNDFRINIVRTHKKVLSSFSSKVLFADDFKTRYSYFSYPLHFKVPLKLVH